MGETKRGRKTVVTNKFVTLDKSYRKAIGEWYQEPNYRSQLNSICLQFDSNNIFYCISEFNLSLNLAYTYSSFLLFGSSKLINSFLT